MSSILDILDKMTVEGHLYEKLPDNAVRCYACGHRCLIREGKRGICQVRYNEGGKLRVPWGYVAALQADPVEKKPFFHFLPGSDALTFGMLGCDFHCSYCFPGDTIVITNQGPIFLETAYQLGETFKEQPDASIAFPDGLKAVTGTGNYRTIKAVFRHPYSGDLIRIQPYYLPAIRCTPDHRIYATEDPAAPPKPIHAGRLCNKHYLAVPKNIVTSTEKDLDVAEVLSKIDIIYKVRWKMSEQTSDTILSLTAQGKSSREIGSELGYDASYVRHNRSKAARGKGTNYRTHGILLEDDFVRFPNEHKPGIPCTITVDEGFARLLGFYCAEGSIVQNKKRPNSLALNFSFGASEQNKIDEVSHLLRQYLSINPRVVNRLTTRNISTTKASASLLFWLMAGKGAQTKVVPQVVFDSPKEVAEAFLNAFVDGDGHRFENGKVSCTTVSKDLAYGLAWLAIKTGKMASVYITDMPENGRVLGRHVNRAPHQYSVVWYEGNQPERKLIEVENFYLVPIKNISTDSFTGDVYNLEVEEEHNYLAGFFLVSNCQNWVTSQAGRNKDSDISLQFVRKASPEQLVDLARRSGAQVVVSSYNEPLITSEWAVSIFRLANEAGMKCAFVSNGNMTPQAIEYLRPYIAGYKIDLKTMQDKHYRQLGGVLENVLEGIRLAYRLGLWVEVVTLVIPGFNDSNEELMDAARFITSVSPDIPWHITAFHPDYKMTDPGATTPETLLRAAEIGQEAGLNYVYAGNLPGRVNEYENTICPKCCTTLIERYGYTILDYKITSDGKCSKCGTKVPGIWTDKPETVRLHGFGMPRPVARFR